MDANTTLIVAGIALGVLALLLVFTTARRRDSDRALGRLSRETLGRDRSEAQAESVLGEFDAATVSGRDVERAAVEERRRRVVLPATVSAPAPPAVPPDPETLGVTRRQVLNRGIITLFSLGLGSFGASMIAFLWPQLSGGFGSKIRAGKLEDVLADYADSKEPVYNPEGRFYLLPYPKEAVAKAKGIPAYGAVIPGYEEGVVALYQRCVHLGCRVPWCVTSQWFECPCHGSQYNRVGEKKGGPAPRGLDRFVISVEGGQVVVDTKQIIVGPPIGTNTTGQEAEGPHCISAGGAH